MENKNPQRLPSYDTTDAVVYDHHKPILEQKEAFDQVAVDLWGIWIENERIILKAPEIAGRTESAEELERVKAMMLRHQDFTPKQFAQAVRIAADRKVKEIATNGGFPRLYYPDIEEALLEVGKKVVASRKEPLQLPPNTGGNVFWGEPSEALTREWPRIVEQTMNMRRMLCVPDWRYRFWHCSNKEEKASAQQILLEMVSRLKAKWPEWSQQKALDLEKAIFKQEYWMAYPDWKGVVDGMGSTRDSAELDRLWDETSKRITQAYKANQSQIPSIDLFPKVYDCSNCAIFDMYLSYWQDTQGTVTAEVIE